MWQDGAWAFFAAGALDVAQQEVAIAATDASDGPLQTPVSGNTSSTLAAAFLSPAMSATIERTCSYPVAMRKVGARP